MGLPNNNMRGLFDDKTGNNKKVWKGFSRDGLSREQQTDVENIVASGSTMENDIDTTGATTAALGYQTASKYNQIFAGDADDFIKLPEWAPGKEAIIYNVDSTDRKIVPSLDTEIAITGSGAEVTHAVPRTISAGETYLYVADQEIVGQWREMALSLA